MIQNGIGPGATVALDTSDVIAAIANMLAHRPYRRARFAGISKDLLDAGLATHVLKTPDRPGRPRPNLYRRGSDVVAQIFYRCRHAS